MLISLFTLRIDELLKADIRWNIIHRSQIPFPKILRLWIFISARKKEVNK